MMENPKYFWRSPPINKQKSRACRWASILTCLGLLTLAFHIQAAPETINPPTLAIRQALASHELDTALQKATTALLTYPNSAELHFLQGRILAEQHKGNQACDALLQAVQFDPDNPSYLLEAAKTCYKENRLATAISLFDQLLQLQPENNIALATKAAALEQMGQFKEALKYVIMAKKQNPGTIQNLLREARLHRLLGSVETSEAQYRAMLQKHKAVPAVWLGLAECLVEQNRIEEAVFILRQGEDQTPQAAALPFRRAQCLQETHQLKAALEAIEKAIHIRPQWPEAYALKGLICGDMGNDLKAADAYRRALKNDPLRYEIWLNLGIAEARAQQWGRSEEAFKKAVELKPDDAHTLLELARTQYMGRHYTDALKTLEHTQDSNPTYPGIYVLQGDIYLKQGRTDAAILAYEKATQNQPESVTAWHKRAVALARVGRRLDALPCFDRVLELSPGHTNALRNKRMALKAMGLTNEAALTHFPP